MPTIGYSAVRNRATYVGFPDRFSGHGIGSAEPWLVPPAGLRDPWSIAAPVRMTLTIPRQRGTRRATPRRLKRPGSRKQTPGRVPRNAAFLPLPRQPELQPVADHRPLVFQDGKHHGVPQRAVGCAGVAAEDAVLLGAQPGDSLPGLVVEPVGAELDGGAAERFEGVPSSSSFESGLLPLPARTPRSRWSRSPPGAWRRRCSCRWSCRSPCPGPPVAGSTSRVVKGSMEPRSWRASRR